MVPIEHTPRRSRPFEAIKSQARVFHALMLRDIKSRWGSTPAYVISFLWPLAHILILVTIWNGLGRVAPYGDSNVLWFAISMLPFMACTYVARFLLIGLLVTKPLLAFPLIKVTDILFSRIIIEILNSVVLVICLIIWLWFLGVDSMPYDLKQAVFAFAVSILMGLGMGIVNGLIGVVFHMWVTGFMLFIIILWMTSGILFDVNAMPEQLRDLLAWQPVLHLVEWMREAYFPSYRSSILDKGFVVYYALYMICLGLAIERFARGRIVI